MKIVCDSCSTKYSISDDKVRGKVFKIRCKKCSHIIVVRGTNEAAASVPEAPSDAVWHLVVDGDQVGPLTETDVRARLSRSEISIENYVWKEGFADWLRLADVPDFADLASSAPVGGELFSDSGITSAPDSGPRMAADAGDFFGAGAAGQEAARAAGSSGRTRAAAASPEGDGFSASAAASPEGDAGDLFGAIAPMARADSGKVRSRGSNGAGAGRHDGGRVENLTAQRSENSVLFSLSNLQSLAGPAPMAKPSSTQATDGSGLIDIRAMAASTMRAPATSGMSMFADSKSAEDDLPTFGAFSSASPVLLSIPTSNGPSKWIYALVGLVALLFLAVVAVGFSILGKPVMVEQAAPPLPVAPAQPSTKGGPADEKSQAAASSKPLAEADLPPRANGDTAVAGAEKGSEKVGTDKGKAGGKRGKGKKGASGGGDTKTPGGPASSSAASSPPAEPEKAKPAKGSLDDLLEGALNGRKSRPKVDEDSSPGKKPAAAEAAGGGPLSKGAVVAGMNGVKGKVAACYAQFKVPGLAMVNVVIAKSGKVSGATVTGKFAGTPTGTCVENAIKTGSFPPSDGLSTPYPFTLR